MKLRIRPQHLAAAVALVVLTGLMGSTTAAAAPLNCAQLNRRSLIYAVALNEALDRGDHDGFDMYYGAWLDIEGQLEAGNC